MTQKTILEAAAGVAILAAIVGACAYFAYYGKGTIADTPKLDRPGVAGMLEAASASSITLSLQDGTKQTFAVTQETRVITQVQGGQVGKSLQQIPTPTLVMVEPAEADAHTAGSISVLPAPASYNTDPLGPPVSVSGTVVSVTASSIVVATAQDPQLPVSLPEGTIYLSNVLAGQSGKTFSDIRPQAYVQIEGVSTAQGIVARSVQLMEPLQ